MSINIQAKDITVQEAVHGAQFFKIHLRNEAKFDSFYSEVIRDSANLTTPSKEKAQKA